MNTEINPAVVKTIMTCGHCGVEKVVRDAITYRHFCPRCDATWSDYVKSIDELKTQIIVAIGNKENPSSLFEELTFVESEFRLYRMRVERAKLVDEWKKCEEHIKANDEDDSWTLRKAECERGIRAIDYVSTPFFEAR